MPFRSRRPSRDVSIEVTDLGENNGVVPDDEETRDPSQQDGGERQRKRRSFAPPAPLTASEALASALRMLAQRALTEREVGDRLRRRGAPDGIIDATVERLRGYNFLDDAALAVRAAGDTTVGSSAIPAKLRFRGLSAHQIDDALVNRPPALDVESATGLALRRRERFSGTDGYRRGYAFLARRGFPPEAIRLALQALGSEPPVWEE